MPTRKNTKSLCVIYALAFLSMSALGTQRKCVAQQGGRQSFDGIVEQLSNGGESYSHANESYRPSVGSAAVPIRPQGMSVRPATFETPLRPMREMGRFTSGQELQNELRRDLEKQNTQQHMQSFIEREKETPVEKSTSATELISKLGMNLVFVLAIAIAAILAIRSFQKGKLNAKAEAPDGIAGLKIDQVLQVARGVSLYLIDGPQSKVLVALDASGIKSVHLMPGDFADGLDDPEAFVGQIDPITKPSRETTSESRSRRNKRQQVDTKSTSEIDENLIRLLLNQSKKAA
ncbi:MAG: hypothetical protein AAF802_02805 [Planctomycetota bacterium]